MTRVLKLAEYYELVKFCALPQSLRQEEYGYHTQEKFAEDKKVSIQTIANWKNDPNFWEDVKRVVREWTKDRTPNVIASLYEACQVRVGPKGGVRLPDPQAIKIWLQFIEGFRENEKGDEGTINAGSYKEMIIEEARQKKLINIDGQHYPVGNSHNGSRTG